MAEIVDGADAILMALLPSENLHRFYAETGQKLRNAGLMPGAAELAGIEQDPRMNDLSLVNQLAMTHKVDQQRRSTLEKELTRGSKHTPNGLAREDDLTLLEALSSEMKQGKLPTNNRNADGTMKLDLASLEECPAHRYVLGAIEKGFKLQDASWYTTVLEDGKDHSRFANDSISHQISIRATFGAARDLIFAHKDDAAEVSVPMKNGDVFAFNDLVDYAFKHGVHRAAEDVGKQMTIVVIGKVAPGSQGLKDPSLSITKPSEMETNSWVSFLQAQIDAKIAQETMRLMEAEMAAKVVKPDWNKVFAEKEQKEAVDRAEALAKKELEAAKERSVSALKLQKWLKENGAKMKSLVMNTAHGKIKLVLRPDAAPQTVDHMIALVKDGLFNTTCFHRADIALACGAERADGSKVDSARGNLQVNETHNHSILSNRRGTVAMAHFENECGSCEFFINLKDNQHLDSTYGGFCVWAEVADAESFKVIEAIAEAVPKGQKPAIHGVEIAEQ